MVFAQAVSTASGATPTPSIYVVAIAEGQASVINVTPTFSFTANASATASVVSPLPQIQLLAAVALAIAYGNVHTPHVIRIGFANVIVWRRMAYVRLYEIEPDSTVFNLSANDKVLLDNGSESLVWSRSGNEQQV